MRWKRIPYWRFPLTVGYRGQYSNPEVTHGLAAGMGFTSFNKSNDSGKLRLPHLFVTRAHIGYILSTIFAAELHGTLYVGEETVATTFDDADVVRREIAEDRGVSVFTGLVIRADDVF
jgi:hypothetical protein